MRMLSAPEDPVQVFKRQEGAAVASIGGIEQNIFTRTLHACALCVLQIGLYPLASLAELQEEAAEAAAEALPGSLGPSSSSQRAQRRQQQQPSVPLLPPVATVRLPGKVSSIAFSPDMQGVISIGDYDGTLTQVGMWSTLFA